MPSPATALSPCILLFHIADDGLPTVVHVDGLDADKLLPAISANAAGRALAF
jgi:hypothetical protein